MTLITLCLGNYGIIAYQGHAGSLIPTVCRTIAIVALLSALPLVRGHKLAQDVLLPAHIPLIAGFGLKMKGLRLQVLDRGFVFQGLGFKAPQTLCGIKG